MTLGGGVTSIISNRFLILGLKFSGGGVAAIKL